MERLRIIIPRKGRARIKRIKKEAAGAAPFVADFSRFPLLLDELSALLAVERGEALFRHHEGEDEEKRAYDG